MRSIHFVPALAVAAVLGTTGAMAQEGSVAGVGGCTHCLGCPGGFTACFTGGTPTSACTDLGCGVSDTFTLCSAIPSCPATEAGQCDDGVNNDAWVDGDTDCDDADCAADPACATASVPTVSEWGIASLGLLLLAGLTIKFRGALPRRA